MKVFRIPVWDNDSGVTHIATTWQLATDPDFTNIVQEVTDSTKYLDYWAINLVVPKGKIYYVRAKRKFQEVDNDVWIGPKKVVNDEAGLSEIIKPETKIEAPFIANVVLDYEDGLTLTLNPFSGNVPHVSTSWIIKNAENGEILYKSMFDTENLLSLNIKPDEIDFTNIPYITVTTVFHGKLGTESAPNTEFIELAKKYFEIDANKKIVPADLDYVGKVRQTTSRPVTVKTAELLDITGKVICNGEVNDNTYKFKSLCLKPKNTYYVRLGIVYDNDDSTLFHTVYGFYTKSMSEKVIFDRSRQYNKLYNVLDKSETLVIDSEEGDLKSNDLNPNIQVLTEETYVGVIPYVAKDGNVKLYFFSKNNGKFYYVRPLKGFDKPFKQFIKFELTPGNILYVDTITTKKDNNGNEYDVRTMYVYKFSPYTFEVTHLATIEREDEVIPDFNTNGYGVLNGEFYWAAIDKNDKTKVFIRKIDKTTNLMVTLFHDRLDKNEDSEMDNVWLARTINDKFMVTPQYYNDDSKFFGYVYDVSKNERYQLFTIPKEVRTQHIIVDTLDNGNVILQRTQLEDKKLYYAIIDAERADQIETRYQELVIDKDVILENNVRMKSGNILDLGFVNDEGTLLLWS
jgi:hypothetical protein